MNIKLVSCDNCAIVFDPNKIKWPSVLRDDECVIIDKNAVWNGDLETFVAYVECPICKGKIINKEYTD